MIELKFKIRVYANGVQIRKLNTRKQGRVSHIINNYEWDECHITVIYSETGMENSGIYSSKEEARDALTAFTESELKEYING